jgi:hypothetical protein
MRAGCGASRASSRAKALPTGPPPKIARSKSCGCIVTFYASVDGLFYTSAAFDAIFVQSSTLALSERMRQLNAIRFDLLSLKFYKAS